MNIYIHASLIEECRKGNSRAQFRLYQQYSKAMYNLAYRILNNREDAEDILQEAFIECFRSIDSFRFESTFGAWLKKIIVNKCINQIKKKKIDLTPCETLPDGYRIILTLYLLEGYDHSEISQILSISESTSKSQYSRAKEKLRNLLSKN